MEITEKIRSIEYLKYGWKFLRDESADGAAINLNDENWEVVRVPHDWAIYGPFSSENDKQIIEVVADGIRKPRIHTGRTGGLPVTGTGWYRKWLDIPESLKGKQIYIEFDGVMSHSVVYLNGTEVGGWPYGYTSFCINLTPYVRFGEKNLLAVKASPKPCASRWYPGAGIYRNVRLVVSEAVHIDYCGTYITTPEVNETQATVNISTTVVNRSGEAKSIILKTNVYDPQGKPVAHREESISVESEVVVNQQLIVENPQLWDISSPEIYKAESLVFIDDKLVDNYETEFGIRTISFDNQRGFLLNGIPVKLNGVCMHHDLGALGAAVNVRAIERQLEILKEMGCNSIRTSHNPPAPELLRLCDHMGFLVIDEAFDEWEKTKLLNGYAKLFDKWAQKDLEAMIKRDRNHPCVIMWSIGNEIPDQERPEGARIAAWLTEICHKLDSTRPVTAAFNTSDKAIENGLAAAVDIPGWNYKPHLYEKYHKEHPDWIMYGSETASCVSSRGVYFLPAVEERPVVKRENLHVTSYDLAAPPWACVPEREFKGQDDCPYMLGEFVWTGFDYLGEPTPYYDEWPSRSSYFGIVDLCGIPKDRFYSYQSRWSGKDVLHIMPHWNWEGMEGKNIPVHCYTSFDEVELFLNGRSMGKRKKDPSGVLTRYRLIWEEVPYESGILEAVAYDKEGGIVKTARRQTASAPYRIVLIPDRTRINADGDDLSFITVRIEDRNGVLCPLANNSISFEVSGSGEFLAADNGDQTSLELFHVPVRKAFNGMCMLIVQSIRDVKGEIKIRAFGEGLLSGETVVIAD